jgi:hypothetical protein
MSSNGSNDTQLGRMDSLFGSQGSTRNFTSLLNPSYLQSPNGKESHKRETDGKYSELIVTHFDKRSHAPLCPRPPITNLHGTKFSLSVPQIMKHMWEYEYIFFFNSIFLQTLILCKWDQMLMCKVFLGGGGGGGGFCF